MSAPRLVIFGSLTTDNVLTAGGVPLPQTQGGNVIYAALGAGIWSNSVGVVSRAGAGYKLAPLQVAADRGIDIAGVKWLDQRHEMNCAFRYQDDGSRSRVFPPDVLSAIPPHERERFRDYTTVSTEHRYRVWRDFAPSADDIPPAWRACMAGVHLAAMPVDRHIEISGAIRGACPTTYIQVDSPWYDARDFRVPHADTLFHLIDRLLPSEDDLRVEKDDAEPDEAWHRFAAKGLSSVVIKLGARGSVVFEAGSPGVHVPACAVNAVDPTGAGDAFCGGFLAGYLESGDAAEAALRGAVSASFAVEAPGPEGLVKAEYATALERLQLLRSQAKQSISRKQSA